jgi:hypothetical protein
MFMTAWVSEARSVPCCRTKLRKQNFKSYTSPQALMKTEILTFDFCLRCHDSFFNVPMMILCFDFLLPPAR